MSICSEHSKELFVNDEVKGNGGFHWTLVNNDFKASNPLLNFLSSQMFFVCNEYHWFKAWTYYINRLYKNDRQWHYSVDSICLDTTSKGGLLLNAMHDINN
jgi:hypothetical protein